MTAMPAAEHMLIAAPPDDLCLRFVNTRYWRGSTEPTEELRSLADLLHWAETASALPSPALRSYAKVWREPAARDAALIAALELRETLFRLFAALSAGATPQAADVAGLNAALRQTPPRDRLAISAARRGWDVPGLAPSVPNLLAPVLWSAGDLSLGPRVGRVRQCQNPACGWLFLDDSKSGNRRWCSMSACGNRAKAHRHYLKVKEAKAGG